MNSQLNIPIAILAGGEGHRMGRLDKCLLTFGEETILQRLLQTLSLQSKNILLNANGDGRRFATYALPLIKDEGPELIGPLGGLSAALNHTAQDHEWLLTVPGDSPFLPQNLLANLASRRDANTDVIYCRCDGRDHFLTALWSTHILSRLRLFIAHRGRSVGDFIATLQSKVVEFNDHYTDAFININTPAQWEHARHLWSTKSEP